MAVLFRINAQSPAIEQALAERRVPYLVRGGERFYERPEVRQALLTLRNEAKVMSGAESGSAVEQFQAVLGALGWTAKPPEGAGAVRERWESLAALVSVAEDLAAEHARTAAVAPTGSPLEPLTLAEVSAELERRAEAQHVPAAQGVTVSTLHSAKGLEWDAVALLGVHEGTLPFILATTPEQIAEERRLLYVGVTRARRLLRISWSRIAERRRQLPQAVPLPRRGAARRPAVARRRALRSRGRGARARSCRQHCRSCGRALADAAERKMGRHQDCPATFDEQTLEQLKEWRRQVATEQSVPAFCVFTDATLVAIAEARPAAAPDLVKIQGLGPAKSDRVRRAGAGHHRRRTGSIPDRCPDGRISWEIAE